MRNSILFLLIVLITRRLSKQQDEISRLNSKVAELMKHLETEKKEKEAMAKQYQEKLALQVINSLYLVNY